MKIGIIVHSKTGNTYSVAEKLMKTLAAKGHIASIEQVEACENGQMDAIKVQLKSKPDINPYDALIFGAPVHGFSPSVVMEAYLTQLMAIPDKKAACYVTEFFPLPQMGGNQAIERMKEICSSKGFDVIGTGVANWSNIHRKGMIDNLAEKFSGLFMSLSECKEGNK